MYECDFFKLKRNLGFTKILNQQAVTGAASRVGMTSRPREGAGQGGAARVVLISTRVDSMSEV